MSSKVIRKNNQWKIEKNIDEFTFIKKNKIYIKYRNILYVNVNYFFIFYILNDKMQHAINSVVKRALVMKIQAHFYPHNTVICILIRVTDQRVHVYTNTRIKNTYKFYFLFKKK